MGNEVSLAFLVIPTLWCRGYLLTACNATPPATLHRLQRCTACNAAPPAKLHRLQNGRRSVEIGHLRLFFYSIIPSMRTSKIKNGRQGAPKWPTGSGKGSSPRFLGATVNYCLISFGSDYSFYEKSRRWRKKRTLVCDTLTKIGHFRATVGQYSELTHPS